MVLVYELDSQTSGNAFGLKQADDVIKLLSSSKPSAFVFKSRGRLFCAGGNLTDYAAMKTPATGRAVNAKISRALKLINDLKVPTLCLVQGDCWGGGVELLSCFDHVVVAPEASFGFWQRRIGLTFGWGGGSRLLKRLSRRKLLGLALQTRALGAHEALKLGLIDEIVLRVNLERAEMAWLARIEANSQLPIPSLKSMLNKTLSEKIEASAFRKLWFNRDHLAVLKVRK